MAVTWVAISGFATRNRTINFILCGFSNILSELPVSVMILDACFYTWLNVTGTFQESILARFFYYTNIITAVGLLYLFKRSFDVQQVGQRYVDQLSKESKDWIELPGPTSLRYWHQLLNPFYRPRDYTIYENSGWTMGSKKFIGPLLTEMLSYDWVVVSVDYRLNSKAGFPTQLMDCKRALRWVKEEIQIFGGNPKNIVAAGDSAGGHMACLLASTANVPLYQQGFEDLDTRVQGVLGLSPVVNLVDLENYSNHPCRTRFIKDVAKRAGSPESAETCNAPITYLEIPGGHHGFHLISSPRSWFVAIAASQWLNYYFDGIHDMDPKAKVKKPQIDELVEWDWAS
ncbi:hypothetical protein BGZ76_001223 [Entomortierella beljakovae]|nr:hypothetical protein BGZ76_001223 [Entomortierella beljakovae]